MGDEVGRGNSRYEVLLWNQGGGGEWSRLSENMKALTCCSSCISPQVDGILQYLPFQAAGGKIQVYRQGKDAILSTDFGLTVKYNWDAYVTAKVPNSYASAVCGLCGNFNGNPADDLTLKGGGQTTSVLDFGNSWQEGTAPGCGATEPGDCPQLDSLVNQQIQSKNECGILADPEGPFRECHKLLKPQDAVRDCVYDVCLIPGQSGPLCDALETYAAACQAAGGTVHPWRSEKLCRKYQEWGWV